MDTSNTSASAYVPGVCNINTAEIARRRLAGYIMVAITLAVAAAIFLLELSNWARLILFFPLYVTAVSFLQVKYKFCVGYGAASLQNAAEGDKEVREIIDATAKKLDRQRTRKIKIQAAGIGAILTLIIAILPV